MSQHELQDALNSWTDACRSKAVARIMGHYVEGVVAYDAVGPLRFQGRPAYQAHWQACMEMCSGEGRFEPHEPTFVHRRGRSWRHSLPAALRRHQ